MALHADFLQEPLFRTLAPPVQTIPFVFNSPHSGAAYPQRFLDMARLDALSIRRSEDCFVDTLFAGVPDLGAPLLAANFPRAYLDVNREPWELDPRMFADGLPSFANTRSARVAGGLGTIPRLVGEGQEIYGHKLAFAEAAMRIETVYKPYHGELRRLIGDTHRRFGSAVLVDCHSMPASIRVGDARIRPDFIVGDRFGMACTAQLAELAIASLTSLGYTVAHNKPYAGGFITEHYGRPAHGIHAIQIEINRGLYMDEHTLEPHEGYDALARDIAMFCVDLTHGFAAGDEPMPLAAE